MGWAAEEEHVDLHAYSLLGDVYLRTTGAVVAVDTSVDAMFTSVLYGLDHNSFFVICDT